MAAPQYDRRKFGWLDRMMFDITLSPASRLVGWAIYKHLNSVSGDAWPSQETMRRKLGLGNIKTVRRGIRALYEKDYIEIVFDPISRSNSYKPIFQPGDGGNSAPTDGGTTAPINGGITAPTDAQSAPPMGAIMSPSMGAILSGGGPFSAPLNNRINKPREKSARGSVTDTTNGNVERFDRQAAEGDGVTIEADPIADTWLMVKATVVGRHGDRAKSFLDRLSVRRDGHDIVHSAAGSFFVDTIRNDYLDTLTAAWRSEHAWVRTVRLITSMREAAQ
ncbi:MAG: helix-turn-helix domain-containing protein [Pseudorhodoplanes sp.]